LRKGDFPSSCIVDLDPFPSFEPYEDHDVHISIPPEDNPFCKPVDTEVDSLPPIITVVPCHHLTKFQSKIREGYKPTKLPIILHDFSPNFLEYLLRFNEEDHVTTEKHMESFECFTDNFEIIHEDVFVRTFSQSLHGNARLWFKKFKANSIGSHAYFHDLFLRY
jgi:hypothetical protein